MIISYRHGTFFGGQENKERTVVAYMCSSRALVGAASLMSLAQNFILPLLCLAWLPHTQLQAFLGVLDLAILALPLNPSLFSLQHM